MVPRGFHGIGVENCPPAWLAFWAEACGEDELDGRWTARVSGFAVGFLCFSYHSIDLYRVRPIMFTGFASSDSLLNQYFGALVLVHPLQMLLEIIKSRPLLVMLWATIPKTLVLLTMAMFWLDIVNTLLMSLEIVDGCEALCSRTSLFSTYVFLVVPSCMLSKDNGQQCSLPAGLGKTYLKSDWVLLL